MGEPKLCGQAEGPPNITLQSLWVLTLVDQNSLPAAAITKLQAKQQLISPVWPLNFKAKISLPNLQNPNESIRFAEGNWAPLLFDIVIVILQQSTCQPFGVLLKVSCKSRD